jgi:hypothetical protein
MKDVVRTQGVGRLILKVLAIGSALTFLAVMMVNACATRAASPQSAPTRGAPTNGVPIYAAPTKAAPVFHPAPAPAPPPPTPADDEDELRAPATKSGRVFRPRRRAPPLLELPPEEAAQPAQRQTGPGAP